MLMQRIENLRSKLAVIKDRFDQIGVKWVIFAGVAAYCYGSNREITDIDILVKCEDLTKARIALKGVGIEGFDIVCSAEIKIDDEIYPFFLDSEMIERINWKQLFGIRVPIISVEDNIVLKAILQRGEEQGKHDVEDICFMIAHEQIDMEYLRKRIRKCKAKKRVGPVIHALIQSQKL
jgi:hypothetical protein